MKKLLVPSLEGLDFENDYTEDEINAPPLTPSEIDEMIFNLMKMDDDKDEMIFDDDEDNILNDIETSVESLEHIASIIAIHGVSGPMMKLADPNGELVAAGIFKSYEELSDIPVKNDESEQSLEGIKDTIKNIASSIGKAFMVVFRKLVDLKLFIDRYYADFTSSLKKASIQLRKVKDISPAIFETKNIRTFTKSDFATVSGAADHLFKTMGGAAFTKMISDYESVLKNKQIDPAYLKNAAKNMRSAIEGMLTEDVKAFIGVEIIFDGDNEVKKIGGAKKTIKDSRGTTKELGWAVGDVGQVGAKVSNIIKSFYMTVTTVENMKRSAKTLSGLSNYSNWIESNDDRATGATKYAVKKVNQVFKLYIRILRKSIFPLRNVLVAYLQLVKAYTASEK